MPEKLGAGVALALFSALSFGLNPPLAAYLARHGVAPIEAVALRTLAMLVVAVALVAALRTPVTVARSSWPALASITLATTSMNICYISSVGFIPVGLAVIILYTFPMIVLVASPLMEGNRVGVAPLVLALVAFCGVAVAIGPSLAGLDWRGIVLAGLAALSATAIFFSARRLAGRVGELVNAFWVHLISLPAVTGLAWAVAGGSGVSAASAANGIALPVAVLCITYVTGYLSMMFALRFAAPSRLTPFYNIEPLVSILAAAVLLGERLEAHQYGGGLLVLGALAGAGAVHARARLSQRRRAGAAERAAG